MHMTWLQYFVKIHRWKPNCGLDKIKKWFNTFQLSVSSNKTHYLAFSLTEADKSVFTSIKIIGLESEVNVINKIKYWGVIFYKNLK